MLDGWCTIEVRTDERAPPGKQLGLAKSDRVRFQALPINGEQIDVGSLDAPTNPGEGDHSVGLGKDIVDCSAKCGLELILVIGENCYVRDLANH